MLGRIGGNGFKDVTRRVCGKHLSSEMAQKYNWSGRSGWKGGYEDTKLAFSGLILREVITSKKKCILIQIQ